MTSPLAPWSRCAPPVEGPHSRRFVGSEDASPRPPRPRDRHRPDRRRADRRGLRARARPGGHTGAARALLEAGADPNAQDDILDSAYLYAGARGLDDILRATLAHGADVTSTNRFGGTALIPAAERGLVDTARILLDAGVDVDHVNDLAWTALHEAIVLGDGSERYVEMVRLLLEAGADPVLRDGDGSLPVDLARSRGYDAIAGLLAPVS